MTLLDLTQPTRIHVVGAGGVGMGAIASVLRAMGHEVTGSDLKDTLVTDRLRAEGVPVTLGHDPANIGSAEIVAISSAIAERNPEVIAALRAGVTVARRRDILPAIARTRRTIAVAGTHGKTTTCSMLALVLVEAGAKPAFIIGGDVNEIGTGSVWSDGEWFVIEADESDRTFLSIGAEVAVVTSVEPDHLESYGHDPAQLGEAFEEFLAAAEQRVVCLDDAGSAALASTGAATTYGTHPQADCRIVNIEPGMPQISFDLEHHGTLLGRIDLPIPGLHNARNATAATLAALAAGASFDSAARALGRFGGVARRFEFRGSIRDISFIDDYAHLPGEVSATLNAARDGDWKRIICVFQPHRYSRTEIIGSEFADAFSSADHLVVTGIYASGEQPRPGVSSRIVVDAVLDAHPSTDLTWLPQLDDVAGWLQDHLRPGDLCLTLGAGDLTTVPDVVIEHFEQASHAGGDHAGVGHAGFDPVASGIGS